MKSTFLGGVLAFLLALFPFFTLGYLLYGDVNSKVFYLLVLVSALLGYSAYRLYKNTLTLSVSGRYLLGSLGLVIAVQYVSAFLGVFPERSLFSDIFWSTGVFFLTHLALFAVLLSELLNKADWSLIRKSVAISAGVFGLLTILGGTGLQVMNQFLWLNLAKGHLTLGNETYAGAYMFLAFCLGAFELFRAKFKTKTHTALLVSLVFIALSPLLLSVGALVGGGVLTNPASILGASRASSAALLTLVGFMTGFFFIRRVVKGSTQTPALLVWGGVIIATLVVGTALLFTPGSSVQQAYVKEASAARIIAWDVSVEAFGARPWLGWGPETLGYAFEEHFDNRLFQEKNLGEIWFERAHNVFLDTLATTGAIGMLAFVILIALYIRTVYRARKKGVLSDTDAALMYAFVPLHLLQMQTGFDTVGSYTLLALMLGFALSLEKDMADAKPLPQMYSKIVATILILIALVSLKVIVLDEYTRNEALVKTLTSQTAEAQKQGIKDSLSRVSSFEALRFSSASFIKGSLAMLAEAPTQAKTKLVLEFMGIYEGYFKTYLAVQPNHYRARMNYAYLLLLQTALGQNRLAEAKELIQGSYSLSPGNPLTYILDSCAQLYSGNVGEADQKMKQALAINPDIEFTQEAAAWLEKQKQTFPNISVLRITNL